MIGLLLACAAAAAAIVTAALVVKRPPPVFFDPNSATRGAPLARWTTLLEQAATTCRDALQLPVPTDHSNPSPWNVGAPVQPIEFTRQLGSLQKALARAQHLSITDAPVQPGATASRNS